MDRVSDPNINVSQENKREIKERRGRKMATQLQPTPILYGKNAEAVLKQIEKKPTEEERKKLEEERAVYAKIKKRGLR